MSSGAVVTLVLGLQYNGCLWRGGLLRVDLARPTISSRLQDIWGAVQEDEAAAAAVEADAEAGLLRHVTPAQAKPTLKLMRRDGRKARLLTSHIHTHLVSQQS